MTRHTPGPWEATPGGIVRTTDTCQFIAETYGRDGVGDWRPMAQQEADARLMAAAPDLLEVLRSVEWSGLEDHPDGGYYGACPSCGGGDADNPATPEGYAGHAQDCELAAAIARATGDEMTHV